MKTIYLQCNMGAAGDMLMAALLDLYDRPQVFIDQMNNIGLPGMHMQYQASGQSGMPGSTVSIKINGQDEICTDVKSKETDDSGIGLHHEHYHMHHGMMLSEIEKQIASLSVPAQVKTDVTAIYGMIARAEGKAHHCPAGEVHFHEVGSKDAIADIVGCCLLMDLLKPETVLASPINVGSGFVHCAHGILPVPAPATAILLEGMPTYQNEIEGELCTPTGAALLKYFVTEFASAPAMHISKTGNGMGKKKFAVMNVLKAFIGESMSA